MRKLLFASVLSLGLSACGSADAPAASNSTPDAPTDVAGKLAPAQVEALTQDFITWYRYAYYNVPLERDFKALGADGQLLPKKAFLRQLATGQVLALLNGNERNRPVYQLYAYAGKQPKILEVSQQLATQELHYGDLEDRPILAFHFTDLQGKVYTPATTPGKVLVLKC